MGNVLSVDRYIYTPNDEVFPQGRTALEPGQLRPDLDSAEGRTVQLTAENLPLYRRIIEAYEGQRSKNATERICIDGQTAAELHLRA